MQDCWWLKLKSHRHWDQSVSPWETPIITNKKVNSPNSCFGQQQIANLSANTYQLLSKWPWNCKKCDQRYLLKCSTEATFTLKANFVVCITLSQVLLITNLLVSRQAGMFHANYSQSQQSASKQSKPKEVSGAAGSSNSQQPAGTTHQPIRGCTFFPGNQWLCHIQHGGQLSSNVMSCEKPVCHRVVNIL